jgi:uncharacterized protein with von Willebrand factor type A (vWA) domain
MLATEHAGVRLAQRGINDPDLIALIGTEVDDGYFVRDQDCRQFEEELQQAEREIRGLRERARSLRGKRAVVVNGRLVTAYHAGRKDQRRLLRKATERDLT